MQILSSFQFQTGAPQLIIATLGLAMAACAPDATPIPFPTSTPAVTPTRVTATAPIPSLVSSPMTGAKAQPKPSITPTVRVRVFDDDYEPNIVSVKVGQVIEWYHAGFRLHTITANNFSWDSGPFNNGDLFQMSFSQSDTFLYYCVEHPWMRGIIVVTR